MPKIHIITVGKVREPFLIDAANEYKKRLTQKNIAHTVVEDSKANEKILKIIDDASDTLIVCMDEKGKQHTSEQFAQFIKTTTQKNILFIIGGPDGISDEIKKKANKTLSLSLMTFTHEMAFVFLLEQIYRAHMILDGKKYHR